MAISSAFVAFDAISVTSKIPSIFLHETVGSLVPITAADSADSFELPAVRATLVVPVLIALVFVVLIVLGIAFGEALCLIYLLLLCCLLFVFLLLDKTPPVALNLVLELLACNRL